jgi:hypothetical protein
MQPADVDVVDEPPAEQPGTLRERLLRALTLLTVSLIAYSISILTPRL